MVHKANLFPAALAGLGVIRRAPGAAVLWAAVYFGLAFPTGWLMMGLLSRRPETGLGTPEAVLLNALLYLLAFLLFLVGLVLGSLIVSNAVWRAVLFPEKRAWAYIRFGREEGRTFLIGLVLYALFLAAAMPPLMFVSVLTMLMLEAAGPAPPGDGFNAARVFLNLAPLIAGQLIVYAALAWPFARLALALPMSLAEGRLRIFEAWTFSKGYGWSLWGTLMLVWFSVLAAEIIWIGGLSWAIQVRPSLSASWLGTLLGMASLAIFAVIAFPAVLAPLARAYQLIAAQRER